MFFILPIFQMVAAGNFYVVTYPDVFIDNCLTANTPLSDSHQWPLCSYRLAIVLRGKMIISYEIGRFVISASTYTALVSDDRSFDPARLYDAPFGHQRSFQVGSCQLRGRQITSPGIDRIFVVVEVEFGNRFTEIQI